MTRRGLLLAGAASLLAARARAAPLTADRMKLVPFVHSPFPYDGMVPRKDVPFLDARDGRRRGHVARDGATYWEDVTYSDRRSLVFVPAGFDADQPVTIVVFFHGNSATLARDVVGRQRLPAQVAASGLNAVLLAPQLAVDAPDSSSGNFWTPGYFAQYLEEASVRLAEVSGQSSLAGKIARAPVVIVAYSGGYNPAAYAVGVGGADERIAGLVLIDALYAEEDRIADWIARNRDHAFLFSAYTKSAAPSNALLRKMLDERGVPHGTKTPARLGAGAVTFLATDPDLDHGALVTHAWVDDPVAWTLSRCRG